MVLLSMLQRLGQPRKEPSFAVKDQFITTFHEDVTTLRN